MSVTRNRTTILHEAKYLLPEQAARLRCYLDDEIAAARARGGGLRLRNAVLAHVLLGSGLRISEVVALQLGDLVLEGPQARGLVRR
jgi:site-specific recombinase XerD